MRRFRIPASYIQALLRAYTSSGAAPGSLALAQQQIQHSRFGRAALVAGAAALGSAHWALSEEAQPAPEQTAEQRAAQQAKTNEATAQWRIYTDVGRDLVAQGRYVEAERYFKKAVEMARAGFGEEEAHVASSLNNLAEFYRLRRQYDLAEPLYQQALRILVKEYGTHDARVAFALHNLGGFYLLEKKLGKAADTYEEALKVKLDVLGPAHSETSNTLQHLAEVRWLQGRKKEAAALLQQSLEIMEGQGVGANSGCLRRRARLAEMRLGMGEVDAAEELLRKILQYVETAQGVDDANTATAAENLATALSKKGSFEEARRLMQRALDARLEHAGLKHPIVAVTLRKMAELELAEAQQAQQGAGAGGEANMRALALAHQAQGVAQQAYEEALAAEGGPPPKEVGRLSSWFRRREPSPLLKRLTQHADLAALELASTWRTLSKAQAATGREDAAVESMQEALTLLTEHWPAPAQQVPAKADREQQQQQQQEESPQHQEPQQHQSAAIPVPGGSKEAAATAAAAAVARREQARRAKVEGLRKEAVCTTLQELVGVLRQLGRRDEAQHAQQRLEELGCEG